MTATTTTTPLSLPATPTTPFAYDLKAMVKASEDVRWRGIVKYVYNADFGARGLAVHNVTPVVDRDLQQSSVDYRVTLFNPHNLGIGKISWCELKSEGFSSARISVETLSVVEKGKPGWAFKPPGKISTQQLLTCFEDGWCFFIGLEKYQNWLATNKPWLMAQAEAGKPDFIQFRHVSKFPDGSRYTSEGFTVPTGLLRQQLGESCWYQLPSPLKEIAQDCIDKARLARRGHG